MKRKEHTEKEDKDDTMEEKHEELCCRNERRGSFFGIVLVIVGTGFLLNNLFPWFSFDYVWPLIIIAIGLNFILRGKR